MKGRLCEGMEQMAGDRARRGRRGHAGVWVALIAAPAMVLLAAAASAQSVPNVVMSQVTLMAAFGSGGALAGGAPSGSSMAIDANGNLIVSNTYGGNILEFTPGATAATKLASFSNPGGVALDHAGNLYLSNSTNGTIVKIPVSGGTYAAISNPGSGTPTCTGSDTAECVLAATLPVSGVVGMIFDAAGDLFATSTGGSTNPNSIIECSAACVSTGTPAPAVLFAESTTATTEGSSSALYNLGGIAVDKWGDLFFTDSLMDVTSGSNGESYGGNVKELTYSGSAYSSTATTLATLTDSSPSTYDNQLDGVAVDANGVVYYATQYDGIFAFPNNMGAVNTTTKYMVSSQGAKILTTDGNGNFYVASYSNAAGGDAAIKVGIGEITATSAAVGTPSTTTNITTILNDEGCTSSPVVNFTATQGSSATTEFSAATTGSCATVNGTGASYATTLTFTPAYGGTRTAVLTATEASGPGSSGTANVTGFATGPVAPPSFSPAPGTYTSTQSVTLSDSSVGATIYYTTDGSTPTTSSTVYSGPITLSSTTTINAIATATGATVSTEATGIYTLPAATPTFSVAPGAYSTAQTVAISDATSGATIYYTTNGTTPTTSSTMYSGPITISSSTELQAIATASGLPNSALASGTYLISSATALPFGVVMNQQTTLGAYATGGALSGGNPSGSSMAVDPYGNAIATNTYGNQILEFAPGSTTTTVLGSFSNPGGVAIDAAGNLYISGGYNGTITKIPASGGTYAAISTPSGSTPKCTGSDTAECVLPANMPASGVVSMVFDAAGDLFFTSTSGATNPNTVFECTAACVKTGTPAPAILYAESTTATTEGSSSATYNLGGIAVDKWGDVFFTDSLMDATNGSSGESYGGNLRELTYNGSTYSTTPKTVASITDGSPGKYDDQLTSTAVDMNGVVYYATEYDGIFALANSNGSVGTTAYEVSAQGAKLLTTDGKGNFYAVANISGADTGVQVAVGVLTAPAAALGGSSNASGVTTILNDVGCSASPTVTFSASENGAATTEFSAATSGSCTSTNSGGSSFPTTVTFTPTGGGVRTATLTGVDSNGGIGTATVSGLTSGSVAATPTFSPAAGTYTSVQTVTISDATPGATIYYTTDGSTPTTSSTKYAAGVTVSTSETLKAIAVATGLTNSAVGTAAYTLNLPPANTPTFSVAAGTYTSIQTVKISDTTLGAKIYYTTDGSTPTTSSTAYTGPISVSTTETINAIATATGYSTSAVGSVAYTVNLTVEPPTFSPAAGTFTTIQTVTLSDATAGSQIYYTTNGSTPSSSSTLYSGPISVLGSETINAIGVETGYANSTVATAAYVLNLPQAATPTISLAAGNYTIAQTITLADTTTGATIYYTTDGTTPTASSNVYSTPLTLSATETLNAIAIATGYSPSTVATAAYTVKLLPPGFALSTNPSTLTIPAGMQYGNVQLTLQPQGGFTGVVTLACSGLPSGATCGFSTLPVNLINENLPQTVTLTISRSPNSAALERRSNPLLPEATLALVICFFGFRKRRGLQIALLILITVLGANMLAGCGSSSPGSSNSTVTVTGTSGSLSGTTTLAVTMN